MAEGNFENYIKRRLDEAKRLQDTYEQIQEAGLDVYTFFSDNWLIALPPRDREPRGDGSLEFTEQELRFIQSQITEQVIPEFLRDLGSSNFTIRHGYVPEEKREDYLKNEAQKNIALKMRLIREHGLRPLQDADGKKTFSTKSLEVALAGRIIKIDYDDFHTH